jgi:hypothetical protein
LKLPLSEKQVGFWGLVVGAVGIALAIIAIYLSVFLWKNKPPYENSDLVLTLSDVRLVGETADVFFSVATEHLEKEKLLVELPLGVSNVGQTTEEAVSISLNFFEVDGFSAGTSSDIGEMFQTLSAIPSKVSRVVADGNGSFNVHFSIDRLLPSTSMLIGEPIQLPKPFNVTENVEFRDGEQADVSFIVNYSISIPVVAAGSRQLIGSTTLQIQSFVGGDNPLAAQRLHKHVAEQVGIYRGSVGWFRYAFSGLASEEGGFYVAVCEEKHVAEDAALLTCDEVYRAAYNLFEWSRLF